MTEIRAVRCAELCEREALGELHRRSSFLWAEDRLDLQAHPDALGVSPEAISDGQVRVAVGNCSQLLGFSVVTDSGVSVRALDQLFVDPDVIRQGIGRALVEDAAGRAVACGCRRMTVVAHRRNFPFYETIGFIAGGRAQTRFGPGLQMHRDL